MALFHSVLSKGESALLNEDSNLFREMLGGANDSFGGFPGCSRVKVIEEKRAICKNIKWDGFVKVPASSLKDHYWILPSDKRKQLFLLWLMKQSVWAALPEAVFLKICYLAVSDSTSDDVYVCPVITRPPFNVSDLHIFKKMRGTPDVALGWNMNVAEEFMQPKTKPTTRRRRTRRR